MPILFDQRESGGLINLTSRHQDVIGPKRQLVVPEFSRLLYTFLHQTRTDTKPAGRWINVKQPQPRDLRIIALHQKHRADYLSIQVGDPSTFARCVELLCEVSKDLRDQPFVGPIPAVL